MKSIELLIKLCKALAATWKRLNELAPGVQVLLGIFALTASLVGGYYWSSAQYKLLTASVAALRGRVEPTAQEYKGLEAIVLASFQDERGKNQSKLKSGAQAGAGNLAELVDTLSTKQGQPVAPEQLVILSPIHNNVRQWQLFLTLADTFKDSGGKPADAFLYVPGTSIQGFTAQANTKPDIGDILKANPRLQVEIAMALSVANHLAAFETDPAFDRPEIRVVQSYFITQSGVTLLRQSGVKNQKTHYSGQFLGHTFLPERPYFWEAVKNRYQKAPQGGPRQIDGVSDFDYITKPYIDLGTNGPIRTYCWGFVGSDTQNRGDSVLCIDVAIPNVERQIADTLTNDLDAKVTPIKCNLEANHCFDALTGTSDDDTNCELQSAPQRGLMSIYGSIHVFECQFPTFSNGSDIRFTVPLRTDVDQQQQPYLYLLKGTVSPDGMKKKQIFLGLASLVPFGFFLATVASFFSVYRKRKKETHSLVENLDDIMTQISDAYFRVNPEDKIVKSNRKAASLMGQGSAEDLVGRDIKEFLDEASKKEFSKQKPMRESGLYSQYEVTLLSGLKCTVHGAPLPTPKEFGNPVPDRFGIWVPETPGSVEAKK